MAWSTIDDILHPLLVVEDAVPLKELTDGYILAYQHGLTLDGAPYDVATYAFPEPFNQRVAEISDFYAIPIFSLPQGHQNLYTQLQQRARAGFTRNFVRSSFQEYPSLYDVVDIGAGKKALSSHAYRLSSRELLLGADQAGEAVLQQVLNIHSLCLDRLEEFNVPAPRNPGRSYTLLPSPGEAGLC